MSVIGYKTKEGVVFTGISSYDDTQLRNLISGKVSKQDGKSLISTSQITRLSTVQNYDDTQLRQIVDGKVSKQDGKSLISTSQITRLSNVSNYNDAQLRGLIDNKVNKQTGKVLISSTQLTRLSTVQNYDDTQLRQLVDSKVTAQSGKSLISTSEITRLANISNYNDTQLRNLIDGKVTAVSGYSLVANTQIERLSNVENYDDTQIRQAISSSSANITQAILNCQIPNDPNVQYLDVTIKLCKNIDMITDVIEISNITHHQIMHIALDTQFVPLSDYYYEDQEGSPKISFSYFTGTLTVKLTAQNVNGFDPNLPWYAVAVWSNGVVSSESQLTQFLYNGYCRMPRTAN